MIRYRLHVPMKRSRHSPEHTARGVMVGTVWAMTPVFGMQMAGVLGTWLAARKLFRWDFSLINGLAWTWTTNVFTVIPAYYVFYLTGQIMLGRFDDLSGYQSFRAMAAGFSAGDGSFWNAASHWFSSLMSGVGLPLTVGWVPWGIGLGWVAYRLSHGFVVRHREMVARRKAERATNRGSAQQAQSVGTGV